MLQPSARDKNRKEELERKKAQPDTFGPSRLKKTTEQLAKEQAARSSK